MFGRSVNSRAKEDRVCVMIDEIFLEARSAYLSIQDKIVGFHDFREVRRQSFANHAMSLMVKSISIN